MKREVLVLYHCTPYVSFENFLKFVKYYQKFNANYKHTLVICFKDIKLREITKYEKELKKIRYKKFIDKHSVNDYDFGSYYRFAKIKKKAIILFLNNHSYPIKNKWLSTIMQNYKKKRILAFSGSYESLRSSLPFNIRNNFLKNLYLRILLLFFFKNFPNPHFRTSNFLCLGEDLLKYKLRKIKNKLDTHIMESGKESLYNFFKNKNYEILIINSDGKAFKENNWKNSNTYAYKQQNKLLLSDKFTRKYQKSNKVEKEIMRKRVWGI
jgi:hypothetical protein